MNESWLELAVYPDAASAEAVAGLLRSESIPVRIAADEPIPGLMHGSRVMVPSHLLQRAQSVMAQAQLSDEELAALAAAIDRESGAGEPPQS